jgi:hypothetical protein
MKVGRLDFKRIRVRANCGEFTQSKKNAADPVFMGSIRFYGYPSLSIPISAES